MDWNYHQPVKIAFGNGVINTLGEVLDKYQIQRAFLVTGGHLVKDGTVTRIEEITQGRIVDVFSDISPNPDVVEVDQCAAQIRKQKVDGVIAIGGGSVLDLAKAAAAVAGTTDSIRAYHGTGKILDKISIPLIAIPTTAGTGSEVTSVSVLTDRSAGKKMPVASDALYPKYALVDPELTKSMPKSVTAQTGIDALSHAIEAYWSKGHQPITDALAIAAAKQIFENLLLAYKEPDNETARENMCEASLLAGLAFNIAKTTGSHACSFPLTNIYDIPHGEACALTLDYFLRINARQEQDGRLKDLAKVLGYEDGEQLADAILDLKKQLHLRIGLAEFQLTREQIEELVQKSHHPNLLNNPVKITDSILWGMYEELAQR